MALGVGLLREPGRLVQRLLLLPVELGKVGRARRHGDVLARRQVRNAAAGLPRAVDHVAHVVVDPPRRAPERVQRAAQRRREETLARFRRLREETFIEG